MASSEETTHCYCSAKELETDAPVLTCQKCNRKYHIDCLKTGKPSLLLGDVFFHFKCENCGDNGEEELQRMKMQWTQVVLLALYNLQLTGHVGKFGYYRWKEHICAYIDKHWYTLFGSHRKKTTLWHGTVAGTLSSGCPHHFTSGANELGETGWWRLTHVRPPYIKNVPSSGYRSNRRKSTHPALPESAVKVEGLRCRRGKTSIAAAMELKAKRETLLEAKEIRRANAKNTSASATSPETAETGDMKTKRILSSLLTSQTGITQYQHSAGQLSSAQGITQTIKQEPLQELSDSMDSSFAMSQGSNISGNQSFLSSSGSASQSFLSDSLRELDDDSQFSHASSKAESWFTEQDLKPQTHLPSMLMSDDQGGDSDSDLEIDPGSFTPPQSPYTREDSPSLTDILSSVTKTSESMELECPSSVVPQSSTQDVLKDDHAYLSTSERFTTEYLSSTPAPPSSDNAKASIKEEEDSVVDSESESESEGSDHEVTGVEGTSRKRHIVKEEDARAKLEPEEKVRMMSVYEERQLLKKLNAAADSFTLPPETNRLRRKLIIRQLKRDRGLPIFDVDLEMNKLARKCWGNDWQNEDGKESKVQSTSLFPRGEVRVLDRFLTAVYSPQTVGYQKPSFLNRLVGTEDDQLHTIRSPYTARLLKPFIRRDYESRPIKMRLLEEIKAYPHRNDPTWKKEAPPSIDYCYVRPQHIPSVNNLCREFFWPGIDMSECLQYPDFSCVVLFRKIVIGFAFMVPDVKYNEAYISFLFTHPEWRRAGIAKFMLYHLIQTCMGKDVTLHVSATNPAMLLYQMFGFKQEELILDFYDKYYPEDLKICKHAFFLRLRR